MQKMSFIKSRGMAPLAVLRLPLLRVEILQKSFVFAWLFLLFAVAGFAQRQDILLDGEWTSSLNNSDQWKVVTIPHNWDDYYGYRRLLHGNLHGDAVYKKTFSVNERTPGKRFFLYFEGVGSYAKAYLNGIYVGDHAGGRTTFTLDVTNAIRRDGSVNRLEVQVAHPAYIRDLPWVCGGCSDERGFSEGSQPLGIFRPVHLTVTSDVRIVPFGIHAWADISGRTAHLSINTTLRNYTLKKRDVQVVHQIIGRNGKIVKASSVNKSLQPNDSTDVLQNKIEIVNPVLWDVDHPYLYKIVTLIKEGKNILDKTETDFGFRTVEWRTPSHQFFLNGKPVFINGVAGYEHLLGGSHAFTHEQIRSRVKWIQAAGFNAFRDAHQPHNLLYGKLFDEKGILWWTQFSAHIWFDTKEFRDNFKTLLREWVIERRNDPAVILWGLQNESKIPKDFAEECTNIIRSLDPTASSQRLVTTCNGGEGTDWDVPQNWTGTYGGDPDTYGSDLKKQILVGEYGAWRTMDLHTEGAFDQNGPFSEDRMTELMEKKVRLGESVKDSVAGHFFWLLSSHDNPGRVQGGEGLREIDRIGPVNYKGMLTPWEEPADVFYMFRSNYADKQKEPMVYISSHTWPGRWMTPGVKSGIVVYSNCDTVELFNGLHHYSLGKRARGGMGTHFQWDDVEIRYNVLYAVGFVNGKAVATDTIVLNHLPQSPDFDLLYNDALDITKPESGYHYVYRVNCGGDEYRDKNGHIWAADRGYSTSWTDRFRGMPEYFASQRRSFSPVKGTRDWPLFQTFRYGKNQLEYYFPLPDGEYLVELYFMEPWLGIGGGFDAKDMRLMNVDINGRRVLHDLDIWSESGGANTALKKAVKVRISGGKMNISFPDGKSGQALISAIAIASVHADISPLKSVQLVTGLSCAGCKYRSWLDIGDQPFSNQKIELNSVPSNLYGAEWLQIKKQGTNISFRPEDTLNVYIGIKRNSKPEAWIGSYENTKTSFVTDENGGTTYDVFRKMFTKDDVVSLGADSSLIIAFLPETHMQPAFDLKKTTSYKTDIAVLSDGVARKKVGNRDCAVVDTNDSTDIRWPVKTGVADIYSVTVKYFYGKQKLLTGRITLNSSAGDVMLDEKVSFSFTREGKWNQFTVVTPGMINAGDYTVRLTMDDAEGLAVSGIDIQ